MKNMSRKLVLVLTALILGVFASAQEAYPPAFSNHTHTAEAQPFADLSQRIWNLMAEKDAEALKDIFHPNSTFVHMGGYWDCTQELMVIGQGWIHYKHAEVYGVDVKKINDHNWAVCSTIKLDSVLGGGDNIITTPFFVSQTFTFENGKWLLSAMIFSTRTSGPGITGAH